MQARKPPALTVDGQAIEEVDRFTYLGSIVSKTEGTDEDVKARINKARQAFVTPRPVWRGKNLSCCTKLRPFNSNDEFFCTGRKSGGAPRN